MRLAVLLSGISYERSKTVGSPHGPKQVSIDFRNTAQCIKNVAAAFGDADYFLCTNQHDRLTELESAFLPKVLLTSTASNMGKRIELLKAFEPSIGDYDAVLHTRFDIYVLLNVKRCVRRDTFNVITTTEGSTGVCDNFIFFPTRLTSVYQNALSDAGAAINGHRLLCKLPNMHIMNNEQTEVWRNVSYWIRPDESRPFLRRWSDYTEGFVYEYGVRPSTLRKDGSIITIDASTTQGCFWGELHPQGLACIRFNVTCDVRATLLLLKRRGQFCCKGLGLKHSEDAYPTSVDTDVEVKRIELLAGVQQRVDVDVDMHWPTQPGDVGSGFWIAEVRGICRLQIEQEKPKYLVCFVGLPRTLDQNAEHNLRQLHCGSAAVNTCLHTTFGYAAETPKWEGRRSFGAKTVCRFDHVHDVSVVPGKECWGTHLFAKRVKDVLQHHPDHDFYVFLRTDVRLEKRVDVATHLAAASGKLVLINSAGGGGGACHNRDWDYCWIGSKTSVLDFIDKWFYGPWPRPPITTYADISSEREQLFTRLIRAPVTTNGGQTGGDPRLDDSVTVRGAGCADVNGTYTRSSPDQWSMRAFTLRYNVQSQEWLIVAHGEGGAHYAVKTKSAAPPPFGWHVCKRGVPPAPHLAETAYGGSVVVVGSGSALLGRSMAATIDSHDFVVRLNDAPTEGYEKDVGHRTSVRFTNETQGAQNFLATHGCCSRSVPWFVNKPRQNKFRRSYFGAEPNIISELHKTTEERFGLKQPTTGFMALFVMSEEFTKNISAVGFDWYENGRQTHYYKHVPRGAQNGFTFHQCLLEKQVLSKVPVIKWLDATASVERHVTKRRVFLIANNPRLGHDCAAKLSSRFSPCENDLIVRMNHCEHSDKLFAGREFTHVTRPDRGWFHGMEVESDAQRKQRNHRMFSGLQRVRALTSDIIFINCESEPNATLASQLAGNVPYITIPIVLKTHNRSGSTGYCTLHHVLHHMPTAEVYLLGWTFRSEIRGCHDWDEEKRIISEWIRDNDRLHLIDFE